MIVAPVPAPAPAPAPAPKPVEAVKKAVQEVKETHQQYHERVVPVHHDAHLVEYLHPVYDHGVLVHPGYPLHPLDHQHFMTLKGKTKDVKTNPEKKATGWM